MHLLQSKVAHAIPALSIKLFRHDELLFARSPNSNRQWSVKRRDPNHPIAFIDTNGQLLERHLLESIQDGVPTLICEIRTVGVCGNTISLRLGNILIPVMLNG